MVISREDLEAGRVDLAGVVEPGSELLPPVHPGEILGDWLKEEGITLTSLARALGVPHNRIVAILAGERGISADTALRLARYFGTSAQMWIGLQGAYDLEVARRVDGEKIARVVRPRAA